MGKLLTIKGADFSKVSVGKVLFGIEPIGVINNKFVAEDGSLKSMSGYDILIYKPKSLDVKVIKRYSAIASVNLVSEFTEYDGNTLTGFVKGVVQWGFQYEQTVDITKNDVNNFICVTIAIKEGSMGDLSFTAEEASTPPVVVEL